MKRVSGSLSLVLVLWLSGSWFIPLAEGKIVYVKPTGNDNNTGKSWALAKQTVQAGLNAAASGDQVWVAAGTYNERITLKSGRGPLRRVCRDGQRDGPFAAELANQRDNPGWPAKRQRRHLAQRGRQRHRIDGFTIRNGNGTG